ncbi:MAG TPA: alpha/beta hydrolase [Puia sp.]|nr:alpha/beta hydrolase [Puia sp.]
MDKTIDRGPNTLFYRDEGKGLPVILLHGFAEDGSIWNKQTDQLKANYRLLIPDLPGSGRSSALTDETSMEKMAEDLVLMLDREDLQHCVLIGHSMGGYISLAFAEKYPERLRGLGLFHSTAYADTEEKRSARRKSIDFIQKNGSSPFIRQSTPNLFAPETRKDHPELVNEMIDRYSSFLPASLVHYYEAMIRRPDRTAILEQTKKPVLFVIGSHDQAVPPQQALQQSHIPALSHIHLLNRSGHVGMLEEPGQSYRILQSYLNFVTQS